MIASNAGRLMFKRGGGIKAETFKIFVAGSDLSDGLSPPDLAVVRVLGSSSNSSSKKQELSADPEDTDNFSKTNPIGQSEICKETNLPESSTTDEISSSVVPVKELFSSASLVKAG